MTCCEKCGKEIVIGEFPFCPHGFSVNGVIGDEIDETHHDLDPNGGVIRFRSRREKQRYLDAHNLQPFVRHVDGDKHVPRWV